MITQPGFFIKTLGGDLFRVPLPLVRAATDIEWGGQGILFV